VLLAELTFVVAGSVVAVMVVTDTQPAVKNHRIGYLATSSSPAPRHLVA
jgi:hypothetical protein